MKTPKCHRKFAVSIKKRHYKWRLSLFLFNFQQCRHSIGILLRLILMQWNYSELKSHNIAKLLFQVVIHPKSTSFPPFLNRGWSLATLRYRGNYPERRGWLQGLRKIEDWRTVRVASHNSPLRCNAFWGEAPSNISNMSCIRLSDIKALSWLVPGGGKNMRSINSPLIFPGSN